MYFVYIIKSDKDRGYYVGMTTNLESRVNYHNAGRVRSTKSRRPFKLVHNEQYSTIEEARKREKYLKSYRGSKEKLTILDKFK